MMGAGYAGLAAAGMFLGQTVSVYLLQAAERIFHMSGYRFRFAFLAGGLVIEVIVAVIGYFALNRHAQTHVAAAD